MKRTAKHNRKFYIHTGWILVLFILFVAIMSWTADIMFFTLENIRLLIILLSCSSILILIGHLDLKDIRSLRARIRFNLFLTSMTMSILTLLNSFTESILYKSLSAILLPSLKPLAFAIILYLPILNILDRLESTQGQGNRSIQTTSTPAEIIRYPDLTRREREVFDLALHDLSNKEIASKLYIAESTVKKHMQNILRKIECSTREELILKYSDLLDKQS